MPDSLSKKIHIPPTRFTGNARLSPEMIRSKAQIESGDGLITLLARLNTKKEQYDGRILIDRFPLSSFLPHDSLGVLSASTRFSGEKYNPMDSSMYATVDLKIDSVDYSGYRYTGLSIEAKLNRGKMSGGITCTDPNLLMGLSVSGSLSPRRIYGRLDWRDSYRFGSSETGNRSMLGFYRPFSFWLCFAHERILSGRHTVK